MRTIALPTQVHMPFVTVENITEQVLEVMAKTPDPRLRDITSALVRHLHGFIREVQPTGAEFEKACAFLVGLGQSSSDKKNEVILASDILGASTLITLQNDRSEPRDNSEEALSDRSKTDSALLGPFWRAASPEFALGDCIARGQEAAMPGQALQVSGTVRNAAGQPVADAVVDVWQASPVGLYENQDDGQPDMNLRGRFRTDAQGFFYFNSVRPAGYPVPVDGPCGDLLRAQRRHPYRPAHLHFMVSKPGYKVLVTQVFADDDAQLHNDVTFSVVESLVGRFQHHGAGEAGHHTLRYDLVLQAGDMLFPTPPIP
jgi:catechol 1,2-dioxygenase